MYGLVWPTAESNARPTCLRAFAPCSLKFATQQSATPQTAAQIPPGSHLHPPTYNLSRISVLLPHGPGLSLLRRLSIRLTGSASPFVGDERTLPVDGTRLPPDRLCACRARLLLDPRRSDSAVETRGVVDVLRGGGRVCRCAASVILCPGQGRRPVRLWKNQRNDRRRRDRSERRACKQIEMGCKYEQEDLRARTRVRAS